MVSEPRLFFWHAQLVYFSLRYSCRCLSLSSASSSFSSVTGGGPLVDAPMLDRIGQFPSMLSRSDRCWIAAGQEQLLARSARRQSPPLPPETPLPSALYSNRAMGSRRQRPPPAASLPARLPSCSRSSSPS